MLFSNCLIVHSLFMISHEGDFIVRHKLIMNKVQDSRCVYCLLTVQISKQEIIIIEILA